MAAVTADQISKTRALHNAIEDVHAIGTAGVVYVGALANFTAIGRVVSATAATSRRFAGEVVRIINGSGAVVSSATGNTGGTIKAVVRYGHQMSLNLATALRTGVTLGKYVMVSSNVDVSDSAVGTAGVRVICGVVQGFDASNKSTAWVELRRFSDAVA